MSGQHEPVVVTGVGVVSPLGNTLCELWTRLLAGESAAREWPDLRAAGFRATAACRIDGFNGAPLRRGRALILAAAGQAVANADVELPSDTGVFIGSTIGESLAFERAGEGENLALQDFTVQSFTNAVQRQFGLTGPAESIATACAAGNYAIGAALSALRAGRTRVALAGAAEPFSRLALVGFSRSRAMAPDVCRPFDRDRSGMLLGEGAAVFVLERADDAVRRGATPLAEAAALGLSCDAYHATAPLQNGAGMLRAMQAALASARVRGDEVDWVNAHGSGTRLSDAAEARAVRALFGDRVPVVSGSKGALGHALGASSALESAICVQALRTQTVPPTAGHEQSDPECDITCSPVPLRRPIRWVLNNAFAFGGVNSALLFQRWES